MSRMIEAPGRDNSRIDDVLAARFVEAIDDLPLAALRDRRDTAEQAETDLSYLRRLLHARIDIVLAEQRRRETGDADSVVDQLAVILADDQVGSRGRQTTEPTAGQSDVEALLTDVGLSDVAALADDELTRTLGNFRDEEAAVSARRRDVQRVVDTLNAEIAGRYSSGTASVDDLLAEQRKPSD